MPNILRFEARTDRGLVRGNNEDAYLIAEDVGLCAVCDGLGGHAAGEIASRIAVESLQQRIQASANEPSKILAEAVDEANRKILRDQQANHERLGMVTTLSAIWAPKPEEGRGWIAHIGDSRIYRFRRDDLQQLTDDHSPVFRLYKEGALEKDQLRLHPQKNLIERSLGLSPVLNCDIFQIDLEPGDLFLLCTDGLSDCLSDREIAEACRELDWPQLCPGLVQRALDYGGFDNITVVAARLD